MPRKKGALNKSTLDRQKKAALLLQQRRLVEERFCEELIAAEAEIERGETFSTPEVEAYLKKEGLL